MHKMMLYAGIASVLLATPNVYAQGGCVLAAGGNGASLRTIGSSGTKLSVNVQMRSAPAFAATVPSITETANGQCRLHLSPASGVTDFRISLTPSLSGGSVSAEKQITMQIVTPRAGEIEWSMDSVPLLPDNAVAEKATIKPLREGAREYALALVVSQENVSDTLPFAVLWAPIPDIQLTTVRQTCGANVCLYKNKPQELDIRGPDALEVNPQGEAKIGYAVTGGPLAVAEPPLAIHTDEAGLSLSVTTSNENVTRLVVQLPLRVPRVREGGRLDWTYVDTVPTVVENPPSRQASFSYASGGRLDVLRGASNGVRVRLEASGALNLSNGLKYQLRELTMGAEGPPVAEFYADNVEGSVATGTLMPVSPTRTRSGRDGAPELVLAANGNNDLRVYMVVLPPTQVERVFVRRTGRADEQNGAVHPLENALLRLEGPGVGFLQDGYFAGNRATVERRGGRDVIEVRLQVPREAGVTEMLRLRDPDSAEVVVPIRVEPNQRPNRKWDYVTLQYRNRSQAATLGFLPPPQTQAASNPGQRSRRRGRSRPWNEVEASTLGGVTLLVDPYNVDDEDELYGVQYLQLEVDLFDAAGNQRGTHSQCVAVVPAAVGERPYPMRGNCTRIVNGEYAISELMDASTRATAKSLMRVRVRHDASQYPHDDVGEVHEVKVRRRGWVVLEPLLELPGPVMAWHRGRTSPGITYGGALFSAQPLIGDNWLFNRAHTLSFQGGFLIGSAPANSNASQGVSGQLSATLGVSYMFRNMVGNAALNFFGGRMWPITGRGIRERDAYWVFRPGFSVPIGGN